MMNFFRVSLVCLGFVAFGHAQVPVPQVTGRVVRSDTGAPIAGAKVELNSGMPNGGCCTTAVTDGKGEYSFRGLADGSYLATAFAEGFVAGDYHYKSGDPPGQREQAITGSSRLRIDFQLLPEAVIRGVVVTPDGTPAGPGLTVLAVPVELLGKTSSGVYPNWGETRTDAEGRFALRGLPPWEYVVRVHQMMGGRIAAPEGTRWFHEAWYGDAPTPDKAKAIAVKEAEQRGGVRITVHEEQRYSVTLWMSGPDGSPPPREYVITYPDTNTTALKQPDGSYLIRNVSPGRYRLSIFAVGSTPGLALPHSVAEMHVVDADVTMHLDMTGK